MIAAEHDQLSAKLAASCLLSAFARMADKPSHFDAMPLAAVRVSTASGVFECLDVALRASFTCALAKKSVKKGKKN